MKHFKIDYFSGIWRNHSLHEVADEYKLRDCLFSNYFEDLFQTTIGGEAWFCYIQNGIKIFIPTFDAATVPQELWSSPKFYDLHFPRIKIDFSGNGLDWYRDFTGKPIEDLLRIPHADFRPTRVDFAVDFVNEHVDLYSSMRAYLTDLALKGKRRVCCAGLQGGVKYDLKLGDQSTIYLGGTSGNILLRIYDKKMELVDDRTGCWKITPPYDGLNVSDPKEMENVSWIRFELQCRRDAASSVLYHPILDEKNNPIYDAQGCICQSPEDLDQWAISNYKTLISRYSFRNMELSIQHKDAEILPFWKEFLSEIENNVAVLQISHFVQFVAPMERVKNNIRKYSNSAIAFIAAYGIEEYLLFLNQILQDQQKKPDLKDISSLSKALKNNSLITTLQSVTNDISKLPGIYIQDQKLNLNYCVVSSDKYAVTSYAS